MDKTILSHYGKAIFEYSIDNKILDETKKDLTFVNDILNSNLELKKVLSSPLISVDSRIKTLKSIFTDNISNTVLSYLEIMIKRNGISNFEIVYSSFIHLYNESKGILEGKIYTAFDLSKEKINEIEKLLSKKEKREVVLTQISNPHLIGGVKIYLDNRIYDYSIEKKINEIKESLLKTKELVI